MSEDTLVEKVRALLAKRLPASLIVRKGAPLLYQIRLSNALSITLDPAKPTRGQSAFQTDLCVFQKRPKGLELPRVVLEFKTKLSTHDVLTYSTKARRHKQIYPFLRYGLVIARDASVPRRFFFHNEGLDFCVALGGMTRAGQVHTLLTLVKAEAMISRRLERIALGEDKISLYRTVIRPKWAV